MSDQEENERPLPAAYRAPYAQVVHHVTPPENAKRLRSEMERFPHTQAPQIKYSNLTETNIADMRKLFRHLTDIDWVSSREHTMAEYASKLRMNALTDLDLFADRNGFMRREANTSTINQNQSYTEVRRGHRSWTRPWKVQ